MKTTPLKLLAAAFALACCVTTAHAVAITGGISLAGGYVTDTGNLNTANGFTSFSAVQVTSTSGDFIGVTLNTPGSVTMNPFVFDPFPVAGVTPLWSTAAGKTVSFDLLALTSVEQTGDDTLDLKGNGVFHMTGKDDTFGTFNFTANQAGGTFSFSFSQAATARVPDGGSAAVLLGLGLVALSVMGRRSKKS